MNRPTSALDLLHPDEPELPESASHVAALIDIRRTSRRPTIEEEAAALAAIARGELQLPMPAQGIRPGSALALLAYPPELLLHMPPSETIH